MKLLRLILQGFKSFADRTEVTFSDGLTMIVGPNGCGKSNISDAVRWVLGEQSARSLRGEKMEDVIFSGSASRKAKNGAEVTMVLDNSGHELPLDTAEVSVTRRVLRNGDSEFQINRRNCRLRDITELFANTGLGRGTLAIIGQNRVDQVLSARPEERRVIFEEVAGISRYRMRKEEGLGKLRRTADNMDRVKDLMAVLEEQLIPMAEAAEKAKHLKGLLRENQGLEASLSLLKLSAVRRMLARYETEWRDGLDEKNRWDTKLSMTDAEGVALAEKAAAREEAWRRAGEQVRQKQRDMDQTGGDYRVKEAALSHQKEEVRRLTSLLTKGKERIQALGLELEEAKARRDEAEEALRKDKVRLTAGEEQSACAAAAVKRAEQEYQRLTASARDKQNRLAFILQQLAHSVKETERLATESTAAEKDRKEAAQKRAAAEREKEKAASQAEKCRESLAKLTEEGKKQREALTQGQQAEERLQGKRRAIAARLERARSQRGYLERADREYANFNNASRTVLTAKESWRGHVRGALGDLLHVPAEYTTAAEAALGGMISHIVTDTASGAGEIIRWMKDHHAGRTTFYPLDVMTPRYSDRLERQAIGEPEVIGIAADLFGCDPDVEDLKRALAGRILIVKDLDGARRVAGKYSQRLYLVTLDGQIIRPGGAMTGGSMRKRENTFFGRKEEIASLLSLEESISQELARLDGDIAGRRRGNETLAAAVEKTRAAWQEVHVRQAECQGRLTGIGETLSQAAETEKKAEALLQRLTAQEAEEKKRHEALLEEKAQIGTVEGVSDAPLMQRRDEAASAAAMVADLRVACARSEALLASAGAEAAEKGRVLAKEKETAEVVRAEAEGKEKDILTIEKEMEELSCRFETLKEECAGAGREAERLRNEADALAMEKSESDAKRREIQDGLLAAERKLAEKQVRIDEEKRLEQEELGKLAAQGMTEKEAESYRRTGNAVQLGKKLAENKCRMEELGPVNPNAEKEYDLERERYHSYESQMEDLARARDDLEKVIRQIDQTMAAHFTEAFAAINGEFQRIMNLMFQGGKGRLVLTDREHPLESGVELYLELPGKKQQPLSLMSGGERALTVIALLISFLAYRPAPFCFVDEIDAALDDANVERFGRMIGKYREKTQFIVITHRKKTMQFADTLQGVTMKEKGVSTLVTVHMKDYIKEA